MRKAQKITESYKNQAMLQIAFIRENQEKVIKALAKRNIDAKEIVDEVVQLDEQRRATQVELDNTLSESNKLSKDIGELMKSGEKAKAAILKEKTVALKEKSKDLGEKAEALAEELTQKLYTLPNLPADIVPEGKTPEENLNRFREMRDGKLVDGAAVLRAKIDMASPNINLRDPAIYRIRRATHHNTGDTWCIYPMYTFAHPIEDALEQITHSICTLEFEDQRPFYDWLLTRLSESHTQADGTPLAALLASPNPKQYEFARLNLTYVITSKRKLAQLVNESKVSGWDDPRMPTIVGLRRRGYTPESLQLFAERIGVTKSDSWIDYSTLEGCLRDDLDPKAARAMAVLDPLQLTITNWDELMGAGKLEACHAPVHPHHPELGQRHFQFGKSLWIERTDYEDSPPKGFFRLFPGNKVRLKYGYVIECTGANKDADGKVTEVLAQFMPDTKSGTPGSDSVKVKGVMTWVSQADAVSAEVRLYDRLFTEAHPDAGGKDFLASFNSESLKVMTAFVEPSLANSAPDAKFQFERHGYFVADRIDHTANRLVFNRCTGLKDTWSK